jgi:hypothetical protein
MTAYSRNVATESTDNIQVRVRVLVLVQEEQEQEQEEKLELEPTAPEQQQDWSARTRSEAMSPAEQSCSMAQWPLIITAIASTIQRPSLQSVTWRTE